MLKSFELNGPSSWTDTGVLALVEGCRQLVELTIHSADGHSGITDASIVKLTESCQYLRSIHLFSLPAITDESIKAISKNCKFLENFSLKNLNVSKAGLQTLFASPNLKCTERIILSKINLCDDCILELVKNSSTIKVLFISECPEVTDVGIYHISNRCTYLTTLKLKHLPFVSHPTYIAEILRRNPKLVGVYFEKLDSKNRIVDGSRKLVPMLQSLLDENIKNDTHIM